MSVTSEIKKPFVEKLLPIAREIFAYTQINPRILIAQAAHESFWGTSKLTVEANNLFGMKAGSWIKKGKPTYAIPTWEHSHHAPASIYYWETPGDILEKKVSPRGGTDLMVNCMFRLYQDWRDSCGDWVALIIKYYASAYEGAKSGNFMDFAKGMTGYATDPMYAEKICRYEHEPLFKSIVV
jgi:flagellum-specific peptidoglycan hydrolase FlgJ